MNSLVRLRIGSVHSKDSSLTKQKAVYTQHCYQCHHAATDWIWLRPGCWHAVCWHACSNCSHSLARQWKQHLRFEWSKWKMNSNLYLCYSCSSTPPFGYLSRQISTATLPEYTISGSGTLPSIWLSYFCYCTCLGLAESTCLSEASKTNDRSSSYVYRYHIAGLWTRSLSSIFAERCIGQALIFSAVLLQCNAEKVLICKLMSAFSQKENFSYMDESLSVSPSSCYR